MKTAIDTFKSNIERIKSLHALHASLEKLLTSSVDLTDILRAEIVLTLSAFDTFIHEITRIGMIECRAGKREKTDAFLKFQIPISVAEIFSNEMFESEIRRKHSYLSFQHPDKVADAIRLFCNASLWDEVAFKLSTDKKNIKNSLSLKFDRRNKIAHEADIDPTYPDQRWPIDRHQVEETIYFIEKISVAIYEIASR